MSRPTRTRIAQLVFFMLLAGVCAGAQTTTDWKTKVRECVETGVFAHGLEIVDQQLRDHPDDMEARGWRARLLAWTGDYTEAEVEYRLILATFPDDMDMLLGLSDVLIWEHNYSEALPVLNHAAKLQPGNIEVLNRRARVLRLLGRSKQSEQDYHGVLAQDPENREAKSGIAALKSQPRHELRVGTDIDTYNFADTAQAQSVSLRSDWSQPWATTFAMTSYQRFGSDAAKLLASGTRRFAGSNWLTAGGGFAHDAAVIPKSEAFFEYGHGFHVSSRGPIRAVEASFHQHWYWYRSAHVLAPGSSVLVYLPREWTWSLSVVPARTGFGTTAPQWEVSGLTRVTFPLLPRVQANVSYGVGSEDFARADQVGRFAARTPGGGLRVRMTAQQDISGYVLSQDRSQARSQTSFGFSYGIRF